MVHWFPSSVHTVPLGLFGCAQLPDPSHWSFVHSFASTVHTVPEAALPYVQTLVLVLHDPPVLHSGGELQSPFASQLPGKSTTHWAAHRPGLRQICPTGHEPAVHGLTQTSPQHKPVHLDKGQLLS